MVLLSVPILFFNLQEKTNAEDDFVIISLPISPSICQTLKGGIWKEVTIKDTGTGKDISPLIIGLENFTPDESKNLNREIEVFSCSYESGTPQLFKVTIPKEDIEMQLEIRAVDKNGVEYTVSEEDRNFSYKNNPLDTSIWWGGGNFEGYNPENNIELVPKRPEPYLLLDIDREYLTKSTLVAEIPVYSVPLSLISRNLPSTCNVDYYFTMDGVNNNKFASTPVSSLEAEKTRTIHNLSEFNEFADPFTLGLGYFWAELDCGFTKSEEVVISLTSAKSYIENIGKISIGGFKSNDLKDQNVRLCVEGMGGILNECIELVSRYEYAKPSFEDLPSGTYYFTAEVAGKTANTNKEIKDEDGEVVAVVSLNEEGEVLITIQRWSLNQVIRSNSGLNGCPGNMGCVECIAKVVERDGSDQIIKVQTFKEAEIKTFAEAVAFYNANSKQVVFTNNVYTALGCWDPSMDGTIVRLMQIGLGVSGGLILLRVIQAIGKLSSAENPNDKSEGVEMIWSAIIALLLIIFGGIGLRFIGVNVFKVLPPNTIEVEG